MSKKFNKKHYLNYNKAKERDYMSPIVQIERERTEYIDEFKKYIADFARITRSDKQKAKDIAKKSLREAGIINEDGTLNEMYLSNEGEPHS